MTVNMELIRPAQQMHGKDQTHQPKIMVAVQVTDKYMADPVEIRLILHQLHLNTFTAVDKEMMVLDLNELR